MVGRDSFVGRLFGGGFGETLGSDTEDCGSGVVDGHEIRVRVRCRQVFLVRVGNPLKGTDRPLFDVGSVQTDIFDWDLRSGRNSRLTS